MGRVPFTIYHSRFTRLRTYPQHTLSLLPLLRSRPGGVHKTSVVRSPKSDEQLKHCRLPNANCPNCLTKNLLEMESLPQIRNLLEMSEISFAAKESGGVKDEVNDEGRKAHRGGHRRAVSAGAEEKEDRHPERVCGTEWVRAELRGDGVAQSWSGGNGESEVAGARRFG